MSGATALPLAAASARASPERLAPGSARHATISSRAYAAAESALAAKGRSFHFARRLLSATHAERATRLYGFCRYIDDLADEAPAPDAARATLDTIALALETGASDDPETRDLMVACLAPPGARRSGDARALAAASGKAVAPLISPPRALGQVG